MDIEVKLLNYWSYEIQCIFLREIVKYDMKDVLRLKVTKWGTNKYKKTSLFYEREKIIRELGRGEKKKTHI